MNSELIVSYSTKRITEHELFIADLDRRIAWHRANQNDPHDLGNAAILILGEVRDAYAAAHKLP